MRVQDNKNVGNVTSAIGNIHKGRPIFGMVGWSCKKGQNGTRWVGWLTKRTSDFSVNNLENIPALLPYDFSIENFECDLY